MGSLLWHEWAVGAVLVFVGVIDHCHSKNLNCQIDSDEKSVVRTLLLLSSPSQFQLLKKTWLVLSNSQPKVCGFHGDVSSRAFSPFFSAHPVAFGAVSVVFASFDA